MNFFNSPFFRLILTLILGTSSLAAKTIFVAQAGASPAAPYGTWETATDQLQTALNVAQSGDQIWVAKGTYYPDEGEFQSDNSRLATFQLRDGIEIHGGFSGSETLLADADPAAHPTILSGEIQQDSDLSNNAFHVILAATTDATAILRGFTIQGGNANSPQSGFDTRGGGLYCFRARPTITDCLFLNNRALSGGALYNGSGSSPVFLNCSFQGNMADLAGGAVYNIGSPLPAEPTAPRFTNCAFLGNRADGFGGGAIYSDGSNPALLNCTIQGNRAGEFKGALHNTGRSSATLTNCIVWGNVVNGMEVSPETSVYSDEGSTPTYRHCLVQFNEKTSLDAGVASRANLSPVNPRFLRPADANAAPTMGGDLGLGIGSPAIDQGDSTGLSGSDLFGNPRILNGTVDLGALEGSHIEIFSWDGPTPLKAGATQLLLWVTLGGGPLPEAWKKALTVSVQGSATYDQPVPALTEPTPGAFSLRLTGLAGEGRISIGLDSDLVREEGIIFRGEDSIAFILRSSATRTHFVNVANTTGEAPFDTWEKAAVNLQDALAYAAPGDEVWVAHGTYYPDLGEFETEGDRSATFQLQNGVGIYGGFTGSEIEIPAIDFFAPPTILSGNISRNPFETDDNSFHVLTAFSIDNTAQLHRFTITGGNADQAEFATRGNGGGLICREASPTLTSCLFRSNKARYGGAISIEQSTPRFTNCAFRGNQALRDGGALHNRASSPFFTNCAFQANHAVDDGGAVLNEASAPSFNNCTFQGNFASLRGGAIHNEESSTPEFVNCIIWNNGIFDPGNLSEESIYNHDSGVGTISVPTFSFCLVEHFPKALLDAGGSPNTNFNPEDPHFVSPSDPAIAPLMLVRQPGEVDDLRLKFGSPAINRGLTPNALTVTDLAGNPRLIDDRIDLGAFEGTVYEFKSWTLSDPFEAGATEIELTLTLEGGRLPEAWQEILEIETTGSAAFASVQDAGDGPAIIFTLTGLTGDGELTLAFDRALAEARGFTIHNFVPFQAYLRSGSASTQVYVNAANQSPEAPFDTWETASTKLQDALFYALPGDTIWVAQGTYYPDEGLVQTKGDRTARFNLRSGVALYGGFRGGEGFLNQADTRNNLTILSGDIGEGDSPDKSYHVILANATDRTAILDGFMITSGNADDTLSDNAGGGLYCKKGASPTIRNCLFRENHAVFGGAIGNKESMPLIEKCSFQENSAVFGGATFNTLSSSPSFTDCSFQGNRAIEDGGAFYNQSSDPVLTNCVLQGNQAVLGGAIYTVGSLAVFTNCSMQGNKAEEGGGAIYNQSDEFFPVTLRNCLIWNNQADGTTTARISSLSAPAGGNCTLAVSLSSLVENYSKVELDQCSGGTNSNLVYRDPLFVQPSNPANAPATGGNLRLRLDSRVLDQGNNLTNTTTTDLGGNARIQNGAIDPGAYEGGVDPEKPVIDLNGSIAITLPFGSAWIDPSAIVTDNKDGDLTVQIGGDTVDSLRSGVIFVIVYTVTDSDGNSAIQLARTVTIANQIQPEFISLTGNVLTWSAGRSLQTSLDLIIWTDLPNASSPLTISRSDSARFWRLRQPE